jgi:HAD superfamily 5'-nucleotidase-like hydrolase
MPPEPAVNDGSLRPRERSRRIWCNRDLRFAGIEWVGFDMDYTLAIYNREVFDAVAHRQTLERLVERYGYPAEILTIPFDAHFAIRGLAIDKQTGHILKIDSHRNVSRGYHGFRALDAHELEPYRRHPPMMGTRRYALLDTLFELPEAYIFAALVDRAQKHGELLDFEKLALEIRAAIDSIHGDGTLKDVVTADISTYIVRDPDLAPALHRLRSAGKRLFLMTNSYADYTHRVMSWLLDGQHPDYPSWRHFFDVIIAGAKKPDFFRGTAPFVKIDANLQVAGEEDSRFERGVIYQHGNLAAFERMTGLGGEQVLYVGDHIYGDILRSKRDSRWRTCMIIPEMDDETRVARLVAPEFRELIDLDDEAQRIGNSLEQQGDLLQTLTADSDRTDLAPHERAELDDALRQLARTVDRARRRLRELTARSRELEHAIDARFHGRWGSLFKVGNEHSIFGELVETYACLYATCASSLLAYSPSHDFRSPRDLLPHELALMHETPPSTEPRA